MCFRLLSTLNKSLAGSPFSTLQNVKQKNDRNFIAICMHVYRTRFDKVIARIIGLQCSSFPTWYVYVCGALLYINLSSAKINGSTENNTQKQSSRHSTASFGFVFPCGLMLWYRYYSVCQKVPLPQQETHQEMR